MKKAVLILLVVAPLFLMAQKKSLFFENIETSISKTEVNSRHSDFGPSFVNDELWFSAFTNEEIKKLFKGKSRGVYYNLFQTKLNANGEIIGTKKQVLEEISKGFHAGPVSWCEKTGELFVTLSNFKNPFIRNLVYQKADINLKIVIVKEVNGAWQLVEELPFNNKKYSVGHPAISITGDTLFFASDKPGTSIGETDIYMSIRKNGQWGNPINLGSNVNTPKDDMFPSFFQNNTLIFSSKIGDDTHENFDLYYSVLTKNGFQQSNALSDFNTEGDDFRLVIHKNEEIGYFSSDRDNEKGLDDIYRVEFKGKHMLELIVMDKLLHFPISNPAIKFDDNLNGKLDGMVVKRELQKNTTIKATSVLPEYMNDSKTFTTSNKPFGTIRDTLWVEKVAVKQVFVLENIYYDFDKWDILPESEIELDKLIKIMNDNPGWIVELGSHTDSRGSDSYNEILSQKRSDSAVGYIVGRGIDAHRIKAKGYGETILLNHCINGADCSDEEHRKNRRTEFKILSLENELMVESEQASEEKIVAANQKEQENKHTSGFKSQTKDSTPAKSSSSVSNITNIQSDSGKLFRVQLIATKKKLDIKNQFTDIQKLIDEYGISEQFIDGLNKYQLGNFDSYNAANELKKQLRKLEYKNCFVATIYEH